MIDESLIKLLKARKTQVEAISEGNADALGRVSGLAEAIAIVRRNYEGRPAVGGKPLELMTRDELLAYIRQHQATQIRDSGQEIEQDIVERVARAIADAALTENVTPSMWKWENWSEDNRQDFLRQAKAAIAAMGDNE